MPQLQSVINWLLHSVVYKCGSTEEVLNCLFRLQTNRRVPHSQLKLIFVTVKCHHCFLLGQRIYILFFTISSNSSKVISREHTCYEIITVLYYMKLLAALHALGYPRRIITVLQRLFYFDLMSSYTDGQSSQDQINLSRTSIFPAQFEVKSVAVCVSY